MSNDLSSNNINLEIKKFFESLPNQINLELKKFKKISVRNKKKEAFDPVTNIDKNIEKFIRKKISNIFFRIYHAFFLTVQLRGYPYLSKKDKWYCFQFLYFQSVLDID